MKAFQKAILIWILLMAAVSAKPAVPVVAARAAARENTVLKIEIPQELRVGASNIIRVILVSSSGQPAADQTVALKINGENDRRGRTSFNGSVDIEIRQNLNIGPVHIEADFDGSSQLNPTSAAIDAEVKPGVLEPHPPLQGQPGFLRHRV